MAKPWELTYQTDSKKPWDKVYAKSPAPDRTIGETLYENFIGSGEADTFGEKLGLEIKGGAAAVARGMKGLVSLPETLGSLGRMGYQYATGQEVAPMPQETYLGSGFEKGVGSLTGLGGDSNVMQYRSPSELGKYISTTGEFLGGGASKGLALAAGVGSEFLGQQFEGTSLEPAARIAGAIVSPILTKGLSKAISPFGGEINAQRQQFLDILKKENIPVTAGDKVGSGLLRQVEEGSKRGRNLVENRNEAFTQSILKTAGIDAKAATADVMKATDEKINKVFNNAYKNINVTPSGSAANSATSIMNSYKRNAPKAEAVGLVKNVGRALENAAKSGTQLTGEQLGMWRSELSALTRTKSDATRKAAIDMMKVVDGLADDALIAANKTKELKNLKTVRKQYRDYLAIQQAASRAGSEARFGILTPESMRGALNAQGRSAFVKGKRGDIGNITAAAEAIFPSGATVLPFGARNIQGATQGAAGLLGYGFGGPVGAAAGFLAPVAGRQLAATGIGQRYLANQFLPQTQSLTQLPKITGGLLSQ